MWIYREEKKVHDAKVADLNGELNGAKAGHEAAFATWRTGLEQLLAANKPPSFHVLSDVAAKSDVEGVEFAVEKDGVVQVSGLTPETPVTYEVSAKSPAISEPVTAIRIDALTDKRLPADSDMHVIGGPDILGLCSRFARKFEKAIALLPAQVAKLRRRSTPVPANQSRLAGVASLGPEMLCRAEL